MVEIEAAGTKSRRKGFQIQKTSPIRHSREGQTLEWKCGAQVVLEHGPPHHPSVRFRRAENALRIIVRDSVLAVGGLQLHLDTRTGLNGLRFRPFSLQN